MKLPPWFMPAMGRALRVLEGRDPSAPDLVLSWAWDADLPADPAAAEAVLKCDMLAAPPSRQGGAGRVIFARLSLTPADLDILTGLFGAPLPLSSASLRPWAALMTLGNEAGYWLILADNYVLRVADPSRRGVDWGAIFRRGS